MPSVDPIAANKRQKTDTDLQTSAQKVGPDVKTHSRILAPYRSLGHITSPTVPFSFTTSVGTTLQTYDVRHLNLVFLSSPCTPADIRRVAAWKEYIYAAFGGTVADTAHGVWVFRRGKKVAELESPLGGWNKDGWKELLIFGDWVVGAFGNGEMVIWKVSTKEVHTEIQSTKGGEILGVVHPSTYLNKIVVARIRGELQIWNVKTGKLKYTCLLSISPGTTITSLINTPHLHHIAFSTSDAQIYIYNILTDTLLFSLGFKAPSSKRITSLSFCTDPSVGAGTSPEGQKASHSGSGRILAAGDNEGDITLWDLEKRRIVGVMRSSHSSTGGGILKCEFLAGQKVMLTTGGDNSLKEWIFDSPHTILPRILRQRSGHSAPPTCLAFHNPSESHFLLSSSQDRTFWSISLRNDSQTFVMSQGATGVSRKVKKANLKEKLVETKAPPITAIAISDSDGAKRDWENILTAHRGETAARTWHYEMKRLGRWVFPTGDGGEVKSVAVSACGNFGFVGSSKGSIDMWNLQSGIKRGTFPPKVAAPKKKSQQPVKAVPFNGHQGAITGIVTDATNRWIASTGLDGKIKFWGFLTGKLLHETDWSSFTAITAVKLYRESDLLAASCDDLCVRVVDTETKKVVRELWGCGGRISDFCFSNDGRWLIAASMDSIIRIWDLATGHLIDGIKTKSIVTALAWSGRGEFLVTGHVDDVGVSLWTNRTLFIRIPTRHIKEEDIVELNMPSTSGEGGVSIIDSAINKIEIEDGGQEGDSGIYVSKDQLSENMLTLSLVPKTRWQTLLHLDLIKQRNKPTAAPSKPKNAPFFLGALSSLKDPNTPLNAIANPSANPLLPTPEEAAEAAALAEAEKSRILRLQSASNNKLTNGSQSIATSLLRACAPSMPSSSRKSLNPAPDPAALSKFIDHFKTLSPALADLEIRSLDTSFWMSAPSDSPTDIWLGPSSHSDSGSSDFDATDDGEDPESHIDEPTLFIQSLTSRLRLHRDWELVNAWMNVFLKVHGELIVQICSAAPPSDGKKRRLSTRQKRAQKFRDALTEWREEQGKEGRRIAELAGYCAGVMGFLRSSR
ncbi:Utp21 specific WD40 associated putative domain-containing protein [Kalaharituber pfeilii]|nr:Utp21 specific WD40 associated putative domain-containing protein [Kalaharituber pfeilii]